VFSIEGKENIMVQSITPSVRDVELATDHGFHSLPLGLALTSGTAIAWEQSDPLVALGAIFGGSSDES
jgi:hypothetical protein